jgi:hypothetical protein
VDQLFLVGVFFSVTSLTYFVLRAIQYHQRRKIALARLYKGVYEAAKRP